MKRSVLLASCVLVISIGGCTALVWRAVFPKPGYGELEAVLGAAKSMGLVTSVKELPPIYNKGSKNVAPIWAKITGSPLTLLSKAKPPIASSAFNRALVGDSDIETCSHMLSILAPLASEYEEGLSGDYFAPDRDWEKPSSILFPEFGKFRDAISVFGLRALTRAKTGDGAGCIEDVKRVMRLVHMTQQQPVVIGGLVSLGMRARFYRLVGGIVSGLRENRVALQEYLLQLKLLHDFDGKEFIGYELAVFLQAIEQLRRGERIDFGDNIAENALLSRLGKFAADSAELAGAKHLVEIAKAWPDFEKIIAIQEKLRDEGANNFSRPGLAIAYIFMPRLDRFPIRVKEVRVSNQVAQIAVSAFLLLSKTGKRPTLAESANYAGISSADPFGKGELIYFWKTDGLEVRSVGRNGIDDGGERKRPADDYSSVIVK